MSFHILRVVLKSGSLTELIFDREDRARKAMDALATTFTAADDYGVTMTVTDGEVASVIFVDLAAELRGHSEVTFARQMSQDRLTTRVNQTRELTTPVVPARSPVNANGGLILHR